jgi:hypothetical protein
LKTTILASGLVSALVLTSVAPAQLVPQALYYKFNEGSGTITANEASPGVGSAQATIVGGLLSFVPGQFGTGLLGANYPGAANYVDSGWAMNLNGMSWTIEFWFKPTGGGSTQYICGSNSSTSAFRIFAGTSAGTNYVLSGTGITTLTMTGVQPGVWTHVAFVFNAATSPATLTGYLNGVQVNQNNQTGTPTLNTGNFVVGAQSTQSGMMGTLDEFRLWTTARTAAEIAANFNVELFNENILTATTSGGGVGDLVLSLTNQSAGISEGYTFVSATTTTAPGFGPAFGIVPDALTFPILFIPAAPGNPIHFQTGFPGLYPDAPLVVGPGALSIFAGQTFDFVVAVFDSSLNYVGRSNVQRVTW